MSINIHNNKQSLIKEYSCHFKKENETIRKYFPCVDRYIYKNTVSITPFVYQTQSVLVLVKNICSSILRNMTL